ncbi:Guanine nucleotide exchange factor for Cdc42p, partial [Teratosphaeriaceae sp. CCFEE 6253]
MSSSRTSGGSSTGMSSVGMGVGGAGGGMYPFPRQSGTGTGGFHPVEEYGAYAQGSQAQPAHGHGRERFTAPAMGRQRETSTGSAAANGRAGAPPVASRGMHSAQQLPAPPRHRSASSPDIHQNGGPSQQQRASGGGGGSGGVPGTALRGAAAVQPPVPDVPAGYHQYAAPPPGIPRSQSNSPANG